MRAKRSRPAGTGRPRTQHTTSLPTTTDNPQIGEEQVPRRVSLDIDPKLLQCGGIVHTLVLTADEARHAARILLGKAAALDKLEKALALETAGISVIPLKDDGTPAIDNWEEYQTRRAGRDEILAWFAPERTTLGAGGGEPS